MPYIQKKDRVRYNDSINKIVNDLVEKLPADNGKHFSVGELNYIISSIIWKLFDKLPSYTRGNELIGILELVKQEFIRRKINQYEEDKIIENGDL